MSSLATPLVRPARLGRLAARSLGLGALTCALLASPKGTDDQTLVGSCIDDNRRPCTGTVEAFFDVPHGESDADVERVDVATDDEGAYRLEIPRGATSVSLRARVGGVLHYGTRVGLRGAGAEVEADPIVCGPLTSVTLEVEMENGDVVEDGAVYFFVEDDFPGQVSPLLASSRESRLVAEIDGARKVTIDGIPVSGGYLRIDAEDCASVVKRLRAKDARGRYEVSAELTLAPPVKGVAPGRLLYGDDHAGRTLTIAALTDPVAMNALESRAYALHDWRHPVGSFEVGTGERFDLGGVLGYAPILGAWAEGRDLGQMPDLIASSDPRTGRYEDWMKPQPSRYRIELPKLRGAVGSCLEEARITGNLDVSSTGGIMGIWLEGVRQAGRSRTVTVHVQDAWSTGGPARMRLQADAATILDRQVDFVAGDQDLELDRVPELAVLLIRVTDKVSGEPVAGAKVEAFLEDDEPGTHADWFFKTDDEGVARALFLAGAKVRLVPDPSQFGGAAPVVVRADAPLTEVPITVGQGFGNIEVVLGEIDDATCRVALMPNGEPEFVQARVAFPDDEPGKDSWSVDHLYYEVAAAAVRPGKRFLFERVPEGEILVTVEGDLDVRHGEIYADSRKARFGPLAQLVEVLPGQTVQVELSAPDPQPTSLELLVGKSLDKVLKNHLKKPDASELQLRFTAELALLYPEYVDVAGSSQPPTLLTLEKGPVLQGNLVEGWPYVVKVSGLGPVDSIHLVRPGEEQTIDVTGAIVLEVQGRSKDPCRVEIQADPILGDDRRVSLPWFEGVQEVVPKRKKIRLEGLSTTAAHKITISRNGASKTIELDPLVKDDEAKPDRKTKTLVRTVSVRLD